MPDPRASQGTVVQEHLIRLSRRNEKWTSRPDKWGQNLRWMAKHQVLGRAVGNLLHRTPEAGLLNLGCGSNFLEGWVNADYHYLPYSLRLSKKVPEWLLDATRPWKCPDDYWFGVFTEHMLEHLTYADAIRVLREAYRTLKPKGWLRVALPDLKKAVLYYNDEAPAGYEHPVYGAFRYKIEAVHNLTQCWFHISVWDADVITSLLKEIGYINVAEVEFKTGMDERLFADSAGHRWESFYVEAQKG